MGISVNQIFYGWHDLEFSAVRDGVAAQILTDINAINWGHRTVLTNVYGAGRAPRGQAIGQYQLDETTANFYKEAWDDTKAAIGAGWQGTAIIISVKYRRDGGPMKTLDIEGRIGGESEALAVGDDAIVVPVTIMPTLIKSNGIVAYKVTGS